MKNQEHTQTKDDLLLLIRSMTPQERRYWKLYGNINSGQKEKSHLRLFEELVNYTGDDSHAAGRNTKGNKLAATRHYLLRSLLKALRSYHEEISVDIRIREFLINFEILFEKRIYSLCSTELAKAKKMAYRFERYPILFEIIFYEIEICSARQETNARETIAGLFDEFERLLEMYQSDSRLKRVRDEMFLQLRTRYQQNSENGTSIIVDKVKQITPPEDQRLSPWLHYLGAHAFHAMSRADWSESAKYHQLMIEKWDERPERIVEDSRPFKRFLSNYLSVAHACGNFEVMPGLIERIRSIPARSTEEEVEEFQNIAYMELLLMMNTDGFHRLDEQVKHVAEGLEKYRPRIHAARELAFYHNIGMAYFLIHDWKQSLAWIERIIAQEKTEHRQDLQHTARMLRLVLWYELGKHDLLEYELVNVERFLRKRKAWFAYESTVVKLFAKLPHANATEEKELIEKFSIKLSEAVDGKTSAALPGSSELSYWAKSKLTGKDMRTLLKEER